MDVNGSIKVSVENFKSLKDFQMRLDNFNVLIGPNGSGKTNVLELFKFANVCIDPPRVPSYPFGAWLGFGNIVWRHETDLPIHLQVSQNVGQHNIVYSSMLDGSSGSLEYLNEFLTISGYMTITRTLDNVEYELDPEFFERTMHDLQMSDATKIYAKKLTQRWTESISIYVSILPELHRHTRPNVFAHKNLKKMKQDISSSRRKYYKPNDIDLFSRRLHDDDDKTLALPSIKIQNEMDNKSYIHQHAVDFLVGIRPVILLRQLNYATLRKAPPVEHRADLEEDGAGLISILFRWYTGHKGIPERILQALEHLFPKWQISFTVTEDGRILLNVYDGNTNLLPPSIPDGFYKLLTILTAVELSPKLLLIDELEASLHAEIIEYILDELRVCDSNVVITTHSPAVIDSTDLNELVLLERTSAGTACRRIEDPLLLREKLNELGVTASEGWLYGKI